MQLPIDTILCDLDATLAKIDHRLYFVKGEKKDFKSFESPENLWEDAVFYWCRSLLYAFKASSYKIIFVSGRWERTREVTEKWIKEKAGIKQFTLYMRPDEDFRPDWEVKEEILNKHIKKDEVLFVLDDRKQVVEMWRRNGLVCLQCAEGDY